MSASVGWWILIQQILFFADVIAAFSSFSWSLFCDAFGWLYPPHCLNQHASPHMSHSPPEGDLGSKLLVLSLDYKPSCLTLVLVPRLPHLPLSLSHPSQVQ